MFLLEPHQQSGMRRDDCVKDRSIYRHAAKMGSPSSGTQCMAANLANKTLVRRRATSIWAAVQTRFRRVRPLERSTRSRTAPKQWRKRTEGIGKAARWRNCAAEEIGANSLKGAWSAMLSEIQLHKSCFLAAAASLTVKTQGYLKAIASNKRL